MTGLGAFRLTQYARGGGCACKIPPGELEETIARLRPVPDGPGTDLMVGVEHGDDGAVVRVSPAMAVVVTADFFTPVVDDAYTFGRVAATNAMLADTPMLIPTSSRSLAFRPVPGPGERPPSSPARCR